MTSISQDQFNNNITILTSSLEGREAKNSTSSTRYAFVAPLLLAIPTMNKHLQRYRPFKHLNHFGPLKHYQHFEPIKHFRPFKHLKHFKPFKHARLLCGLAFVIMTVTSIYDAKKSLGEIHKAEHNLAMLGEVKTYLKDSGGDMSTIKEAKKFFTRQLDSSKKDLAINIGLIAAGIVGVVGSVINAPTVLLVATVAMAAFTGISLIRSIVYQPNEKSTKIAADLQKMSQIAESKIGVPGSPIGAPVTLDLSPVDAPVLVSLQAK